jgi:hypothetical protein
MIFDYIGEISMYRNQKAQQSLLLLSILSLILIYSSVTQISGNIQSIEANPIKTFLLAKPETVFQGDHFNVSLSITNMYFEDILNVSLNMAIPEEIDFVNSTLEDLVVSDNATELNYDYGKLEVDTNIIITSIFNVTSSDTKTIVIEGINVSYRHINGISSYTISNNVDLLLSGEKSKVITTSLAPLPSGTIPPSEILIIFAYVFPIVAFVVTAFILRRIRRF